MKPAITIGNFDGVHRGHAALVRRAREFSGTKGKVIAITFEPHPATILRPSAAPARLATSAQRREWLIDAGADEVVELEPTLELLGRQPDEFIQTTVERFQPAAFVEGDDFRFGRGRRGDSALLAELGRTHQFETIIVPPVDVTLTNHASVRAGSTLTRWMLERGRVRDAAAILGRPYELSATVTRGEQRGRTIGFPTANLAGTDQLLPADGVYSGVARRGESRLFPVAISVGSKPTFGVHQRLCEAYLIGYDGPVDDYGWSIRLEFHDWLRDQLTFPSVPLLIEQLHRDVAAAEESLGFSKQSA